MPHYEVSERHRAEWESLRGLGRDGLFGPSAGLWEQAAVLVGGGAVVLEMRVKRKSWILGGTELTATDSLESHDFCHSDVREVFVPIPADAAVDDVVVNIRLVSGVLSLYFSLSLSLSSLLSCTGRDVWVGACSIARLKVLRSEATSKGRRFFGQRAQEGQGWHGRWAGAQACGEAGKAARPCGTGLLFPAGGPSLRAS